MKKLGFTLAEVLIALAIVGVVAAITLPTLTSSTKKETNAAKVQVAVSDLENAFTTMLAQEAAVDLEETSLAETDKMIDNLSNYIKLTKVDGNHFKLKGGATVECEGAVYYEDMVCSIDVNGHDVGPNKTDFDRYLYKILNTGLLEKMETSTEGLE